MLVVPGVSVVPGAFVAPGALVDTGPPDAAGFAVV